MREILLELRNLVRRRRRILIIIITTFIMTITITIIIIISSSNNNPRVAQPGAAAAPYTADAVILYQLFILYQFF